MDIFKEIYNSIKKKESNIKESIRLGLMYDDYVYTKRYIIKLITQYGDDYEIVKPYLNIDTPRKLNINEGSISTIHDDVEKGQCRIECVTSFCPKTPEEIINLLKIDTTKWKLSQYWNKEKPNGKWLISALISKITIKEKSESNLLEMIKSFKLPKLTPINLGVSSLIKSSSEKVCGILSLQDLHFGKPGNEDMDVIMENAIKYLIEKAHLNYHMEKLIFIIGPDTLNMDTFDGATTKGTPVENSETPMKAYLKAFNAIIKCIPLLKKHCETLDVVFIPGNHDRLSSFHLVHAVSQVFESWSDITFDVDYFERKVFVYGKNMFALEHGDMTAKNNPLIYATEFPNEWGITSYRTLYTGHFHGRKTKEFITENEECGFVTKIIPALTSSDYWHYHNKYVGNRRSASLHLHDYYKGFVSEFIYSI